MQAVTRSDVRKAIKAAPNEVHSDKINRFDLKTPKSLKDASVVLIVGPGGITEEMTIHRPIGITDLQDDDWVMTRTNEIHTLFARKDDPSEANLTIARNKRKNDYLIQNKLLMEKDGKYFYPQDEVKTRNDYLAEADLKFRAKKKDDKSEQTGTRVDFLDEKQKEAELSIIKFLKTEAAQTYINSGDGHQSYRTRGGVYDNEDQIAITSLGGKQPHQVVDTLNREIHNVIGKGESVVINVVKSQHDKALEGEVSNLQAMLQQERSQWNAWLKSLSQKKPDECKGEITKYLKSIQKSDTATSTKKVEEEEEVPKN
jgi:hypothetical protein